MKKILFIFDRVTHYLKDLFQRLEADLPGFGYELHLLSGQRLALRVEVGVDGVAADQAAQSIERPGQTGQVIGHAGGQAFAERGCWHDHIADEDAQSVASAGFGAKGLPAAI